MEKKTKTVKIICAWCGMLIRVEQWPTHEGEKGGESASHGICEDCKREVVLNSKRKMENGKTDKQQQDALPGVS